MSRRPFVLGLLSLAALGVLPARLLAGAEPPVPLTVLAAASLTESLQAVGGAWQAAGHGPVTFSFDGSSRLAKQVEAGVPADVFISADADWVDHLAARSLLAPGTRVDLVGNTLVAVVAAASPSPPANAAALAGPGVRHLALAGENVPAGRYARAALTHLGVWDTLAPRVVSGDNVRTALGWVATGEAEAGIVYATDAKVEPRVRVAFPFPAESHPPIVYPAAVLAHSAHPAEARAFVAWCAAPAAQATFAAAGFLPPPKAAPVSPAPR